MNKNDFKPIAEFFEKSENFIFRSVENVNHRPHPYVIGSRHIGFAADHFGGMLSEAAIIEGEKRGIHCAASNCRVPYEQHTCDTVCFLTLKRNMTVNEAQEELKNIDTLMKENKVDGFAFVDTPDKFRITNPAEQA